MFTLSFWLPALIFVGVWILAWQFFKRVAAESEKSRQEMMKNEPHNPNSPDPTVYP